MDSGTMNSDLLLTIAELTIFFDGQASYQAISQWVQRKKLVPVGRNGHGQVLIRLGDAQRVEADISLAKRGRPRHVRPPRLPDELYL